MPAPRRHAIRHLHRKELAIGLLQMHQIAVVAQPLGKHARVHAVPKGNQRCRVPSVRASVQVFRLSSAVQRRGLQSDNTNSRLSRNPGISWRAMILLDTDFVWARISQTFPIQSQAPPYARGFFDGALNSSIPTFPGRSFPRLFRLHLRPVV